MSLIGDFNFTTFCSASPTLIPSPTSPNSSTMMLTGTRFPIRATPVLGGQSGSLAETTLDTGYEPKICVDVSGEHTPIHFPLRDNIFNQEDDLTNTVANPVDFDRFHCSAATAVPALLNLGSFSSTGKLVRYDEFVASSFSSTGKSKQRIRCRC